MIILTILKKIGRGLFYVCVPFVMIILVCVFGLYGVFAFIILLCKSIYYFFTGRKYTNILPEDIEAKERLSNMVRTPNHVQQYPQYQGPNPPPQQMQNDFPRQSDFQQNTPEIHENLDDSYENIEPIKEENSSNEDVVEKYNPYSSNNNWEDKQ